MRSDEEPILTAGEIIVCVFVSALVTAIVVVPFVAWIIT